MLQKSDVFCFMDHELVDDCRQVLDSTLRNYIVEDHGDEDVGSDLSIFFVDRESNGLEAKLLIRSTIGPSFGKPHKRVVYNNQTQLLNFPLITPPFNK